jgi:hypothetical protein
MNEQLIAHMRARIEQCRRLASMISNENAREILLQMAEEGEADVERLQAGEELSIKPSQAE